MARRTNKDLVEAVLKAGKDYDTINRPDLEPYMRVGQNKIDQLVANCSAYEITVPDAEVLKDLETWVSAWAYKASDQQHASKSVRSFASYKGLSGKGLELNNYGQIAMEMDPTGLLSVQEQGATVGGAWTGRRPSEQTPYVDRD